MEYISFHLAIEISEDSLFASTLNLKKKHPYVPAGIH